MTPHQKEFIKLFEGIVRGPFDAHTVWRDWLELSYCTLAQQAPGRSHISNDPSGSELEARYMRCIQRYVEDDVRFVFPELLGLVMIGVSQAGDFLGEIAGNMELLHSRIGQFFTPFDVSLMMARMSLDAAGIKKHIEERGYFTLAEPTCGAGGMVLAVAKIVEELDFPIATSMLVHAQDIEDQAFKMTYLQLCARGVSGVVSRGNTLSMDMQECAWTIPSSEFLKKHGSARLFDEQRDGRPKRIRKRNRVFAEGEAI